MRVSRQESLAEETARLTALGLNPFTVPSCRDRYIEHARLVRKQQAKDRSASTTANPGRSSLARGVAEPGAADVARIGDGVQRDNATSQECEVSKDANRGA